MLANAQDGIFAAIHLARSRGPPRRLVARCYRNVLRVLTGGANPPAARWFNFGNHGDYMVSHVESKRTPGYGFKRPGLAAIRNLVELCDRDEVLPWQLLTQFGIGPKALRPGERMQFKDASQALCRRLHPSSGIHTRDLLWRIAEALEIDGEVAQSVSGQESLLQLKSVVADAIDCLLALAD